MQPASQLVSLLERTPPPNAFQLLSVTLQRVVEQQHLGAHLVAHRVAVLILLLLVRKQKLPQEVEVGGLHRLPHLVREVAERQRSLKEKRRRQDTTPQPKQP